ncbi:hypothetical protein B005_4870 [Nocardiopsis alba ATCC BAA-2165]|uniref:Uncharacterized protein n=1 Tax=Nocardiopsis alba (strain ATCC BAA-2165 / BE74) TaxID=1205910 RepID=J7L7T0_NOCAA|nr:hypothetical protein B005_4870 [Nocardiopsis alba ATCC BAA-2165]
MCSLSVERDDGHPSPCQVPAPGSTPGVRIRLPRRSSGPFVTDER